MNVYDPIAEIARSRPRLTAVITSSAVLSFSDLDAAVTRAAHAIHARGLRSGDRVGVSVRRPSLHLVVMLALARLGIAHVALPPSDPPLLRQSVEARLALAAVIAALKDASGAGIPVVEPQARWLADDAPSALAPPVQEHDPVWLILKSSGTTGAPKFAELTHRAAIERYRRFEPLFGAAPGDVFWPLSALDFVVAKQRALFCLQTGAAVCLPEGMKTLREALDFARRARVTLACGTPLHMALLADMEFPMPALPALRAFEARSAPISEQLRQRFREKFSDTLHVVYATNETETISLATPSLQKKIPATVGMPVAGISVEVVDGDHCPLPAGEVGQIRVRGAGVIGGYVANAADAAASFRDGWFYPGDLASLSPEGAILLHGRTDEMMIFDGMNIYPAEIETVLADCPGVVEAAAFPVHSERHQDIPAAAVVAAQPVTQSELMAHCRARLGRHSPHVILVVPSLPRNAAGKVLKQELGAWAGEHIARTRARGARRREGNQAGP